MTENKDKKRKISLKGLYAVTLLIMLTVALITKFISDNSANLSLEDTYVPTAQKPSTNVYTMPRTLPPVTFEELFETPTTLTTAPIVHTQAPTEPVTEEPTLFAAAVPYESYYSLPLGTSITKEYSDSAPVYSVTLGDWRAHNAVDFAGALGDRVGSIAPGKVMSVYDDAMLGRVVTIDHGNGVEASYCGLSPEGTLTVGAIVGINETVGFLGEVPCEKNDAPHLHLALTLDGAPVNPLNLMGK